jgi:hypothetical protein
VGAANLGRLCEGVEDAALAGDAPAMAASSHLLIAEVGRVKGWIAERHTEHRSVGARRTAP